MKRIILILSLLCAFPFTGNAQRKRAFLVGISNYRTNGYKVWNDIHGAEDIEVLIEPVLRKQKFSTIQCLTNSNATYQNIITSLAQFANSCKPKDIVYLHFSCHGQPVEDGLLAGYPTDDEADRWDESLVPIDAGKEYQVNGYHGEKHIIDDELRKHVLKIRQKAGSLGFVYVIIDACHAGNMERDGFETIRGTNEGLSRNPQNKYKAPEKPKRNTPLQSPFLAPVLYVEACESFQRNQEITYEGREYGALSFNIWQALSPQTDFPKDIQGFKNILSHRIKHNMDKRNSLWPRTQTIVFEE